MEKKETIDTITAALLFRNRLKRGNEALRHYGSATRLLAETKDDNLSDCKHAAEKEWDFIQKHDIAVTSPLDDNYPQRLKQCVDAPMALFSKGDINFNTKHIVSVVGTRSCTERGKETTRRIIMDLAARLNDLTIVSGLAYGIDIVAHRAALEAGVQTIAVLGHGLDRIYPAAHRNTAIAMLKNGGLITEYTSLTEPDRFNFVARDRIIAGMADAVIVAESKDKGGSLITASMAFDYSRPIFAIPGRPDDLCSQGCNRLIKEHKATLAENADDIIKTMMWDEEAQNKPRQTSITEILEGMTDEEARIIQLLKQEEDGMHVNDMMSTLKMPYSALVAGLMTMEMKNWVKSLPGGIYRAIL